MKRSVHVLTALLVVGSASVGFLPVAEAAGMQQALVPTIEAWYQPDPTCAQPTGCVIGAPPPVSPPVALPAPNPFPGGTMHVGWSGSTETARSYLALPIPGGTISAAALDVPLDTAPADGDAQSSGAKVQACLVSDSIGRAEASFAPPPAVDCRQHAALTYKATPAPHLVADLTPLLPGLSGAAGIALLPDAVASSGTDAWRVVFSAHDRTDAGKTPPAVLTVTVDVPEQDEVVDTGPPPIATAHLDPPVATPDLSAPLAPAAALPDVVAAPAPAAAGPAVSALPPVRTVRYGFQYPAVFLVPVALLVLVPLAARALTTELDLTVADGG